MRKNRVLRKGARYHVFARANNKELLLAPDEIKELMTETIKRAKLLFLFDLENFVIMGNHFHFLILPKGDENLSRIMQWIMSVFAMAYNRKTGHTGHFWGDRFKSCILQTFRQCIRIFEYIDKNPETAKIIVNYRDWRHGGIGHRRAGRYDVISRLPKFFALLFGSHSQLALPSPLS